MSRYSGLSREELEARLEAAERVCVMFGWMPVAESERAKAAHELWRVWLEVSGEECSPVDHACLKDLIPSLAAMRDAQRSETIRRMKPGARELGDTPGDQP